MDLDRLRRSSTFRGRVTVLQQVTTRQREQNQYLSQLYETGQTLSGEDLTDADTGQPVFVFGLTPMIAPYIVR